MGGKSNHDIRGAGTWEVARDADWYSVSLVAGQSYRIELVGDGEVSLARSPANYHLLGSPISASDGPNGQRFGHFTAAVSGLYHFSATGGFFSAGSDYGVIIKPVDDDYADGFNSTGRIVNGAAQGTIEYEGDSDFFKMNVVAGRTYSYTLAADDGGYSIFVRKSDGATLDGSSITDDSGNVIYRFTASENATYAFVVTAPAYQYFSSNPFTPGTYTVNVSSIAIVDDYAANASTTGSISLSPQDDGSRAGTVSAKWETPHDVDWFKVDLVAGETYRFTTVTDSGQAIQGSIPIVDAGGSILGYDGFTAPSSGSYYIAASANGSWMAGSVSYRLSVATVTDDYTNSSLRAGALILRKAGSGVWEMNGDSDWFAIDLLAGQSYVVEGSFGAGGYYGTFSFTDVDPVQQLIRGNVFTPTADGTYYVQATGYRYSATGSASYQLTVRPYVDDYADNVHTSGALTVGGSVDARIEVARDTDWFAVTLEAGKSYFARPSGLDANISLYDADGQQRGGSVFTADTGGVYYLSVTATTAGRYTLNLSEYTDDTGDNSATSGQFIQAAGQIDGETHAGTAAADQLSGSNANDILLGLGGADRLAGGRGDDVLAGGNGNDILSGGVGADRMAGGVGNDRYIVDNLRDVIVEAPNEGIDTVEASIHYTLGDNIERLQLTGSSHIRGTGNMLDNILFGNDGNNVLDGRDGADTMVGGLGNDTYIVDNARDVVIEQAGAGTDVVEASISYKLGDHVERLRLAGSTDINGIGNALDNRIFGNDGDNILNGGAGADMLFGRRGADTLMGGAGRDGFVFDTPLGGGNIDRIADFSVTDDSIYLDRAVFARAGTVGVLTAGAFVTGPRALDPADRIVYNSTTGALYYDADGNGAGAAVQFATLTPGLAMTAGDFILI